MHAPHDRTSRLCDARHWPRTVVHSAAFRGLWPLRCVRSFRLGGGNGGCMSTPPLPLPCLVRSSLARPSSAPSGAKRGGCCHVPRAVCHPPGGCSRAPFYGKRALLPSLHPSHGARVGTGAWELMPGSSAPPGLSRIDRISCLLAQPTPGGETPLSKLIIWKVRCVPRSCSTVSCPTWSAPAAPHL